MISERAQNGTRRLLLPNESLIVENRWILRFKASTQNTEQGVNFVNRKIKVVAGANIPVEIGPSEDPYVKLISSVQEDYSVKGFRSFSSEYELPTVMVDGKRVELTQPEMPGHFILVDIFPKPKGVVRVSGIGSQRLIDALVQFNKGNL
jgi:hypothetical protein